MTKLVVMITIIIIIIKWDETETLTAATSNERIAPDPDNY
jgi:hypothetical protein